MLESKRSDFIFANQLALNLVDYELSIRSGQSFKSGSRVSRFTVMGIAVDQVRNKFMNCRHGC